MSLEITNYTNILIELNKAVKMHNFYPAGHPNLDLALTRCYTLLKEALVEFRELKWKVDLKGFFAGKVPLGPGNADLSALARKAFFRSIKEITITGDVTLADLRTLLTILKLEPDEIKERGGAEAIFAAAEVSGVLLNEMSFAYLKELKAELDRKKAEEEDELEAGETEEAPETDEGAADEELDQELPPEIAPERDETLSELIARLAGETDFLRYNDLSVRIKERSDELFLSKRLELIFPVLSIFALHSAPDSTLDEGIRELAAERLHEFMSGDVIRYLVSRAERKGEPERESVQRVLLTGGDIAIEMLLDALIDSRDASERRNLYNTLLLFGPAILPHISTRLSRPEWYAVRQMVSLLGELRNPDTLEMLETTYGNDDIRIKKEVLKSVVKIPSPRSKEMLLAALDSPELTVKCQAIICLGVLRDPAMVDLLGGLALKKESFGDNNEIRKEAVKALGLLGDGTGVPFLKKILSTKTWFINKKGNEELRVLAAQSLAAIGTDDAYASIKEAAEHTEGELYFACKRILEGRENTE